MADYKALIRIRRWELDEQRRQLGELNDALNTILNEKLRLLDELHREQKAVTEADFLAASAIGNFTDRILKQQRQLEQARRSIEQQIEEKTEEVRQAFQELKKFELAQEEIEAQEAAEQNRRETIELDDIAVDSHSRRQREDSG